MKQKSKSGIRVIAMAQFSEGPGSRYHFVHTPNIANRL